MEHTYVKKKLVAYLKFKLNSGSCILICNPIAHFQSTILPHIAPGTASHPIEGMRPQMREWQQFGPNNTKCCILAQVHKMA